MILLFLKSKINMNKDKKISPSTIRANFLVDNKEKEVLIEKKIISKVYKICKIYFDNNVIKIIINRADKYDTNEILKKINENRIFRGAFKTTLNIEEYPIQSYYLEEKILQNLDNNSEDEDDREKEFILKILSLCTFNKLFGKSIINGLSSSANNCPGINPFITLPIC